MIYHCPDCGYREEKESFGWPIHCGSTMRKGEPETVITPEYMNLRLWEMATEVDYHADELTEWETDFIIDMCIYRDEQRCYSGKQKAWIINLWEKYCC